jgi:hypothetical protein
MRCDFCGKPVVVMMAMTIDVKDSNEDHEHSFSEGRKEVARLCSYHNGLAQKGVRAMWRKFRDEILHEEDNRCEAAEEAEVNFGRP